MKKVWVPGSKSITNRALILAALSDKTVVLKGVLESDDARYMAEALRYLGVEIEETGAKELTVTPPENLKGEGAPLFIGNAGTAARFLSALSLVVEGDYILTGVDRMKERPQGDLFETLRRDLDLEIDCLERDGFLPARFGSIKGEFAEMPVVSISGKVSSQFLSGLLLVAAKMPKGLTIKVTDSIPSLPYIKMTIELLKIWGIDVTVSEDWLKYEIQPGIKAPSVYNVPSDMSSASYPLLWSVLRGADISIENFGSKTLQGDEQFLEVIKAAGAQVRREGDRCLVTAPKVLSPMGDWNWESMPDVSMTGMILAAFCPGTSKFTGLESLRVKECDRIVAMEQLRDLNVKLETVGDEVTITGADSVKIMNDHLAIKSFDDHRIAMCFGVLKSALDLGADPYQKSLIEVLEPECTAKTWPEFWLDLADWEGQLRPVSSLIVRDNDKYLIVKKPRTSHAWQFPQGGVDAGETFRQAALRELQEECGASLNVKIKGERPVGHYRYFFPEDFERHAPRIVGAQVHFFVADFIEGEVDLDQEEIIDHAWVAKDDFDNYFEGEYLQIVNQLV